MLTSPFFQKGGMFFKTKKILFFLGISFCILNEISAQPSLIPTDPVSNQYPVTYTDPAQRIVRLEFDEDITVLSTTAGWTITVGGSPVAIAGPVFDPTNHRIIQFQLASSIIYGNSVQVTYDQAGASPRLAGAGGQVASFGPVNAVNNLVINCDAFDLTKFDYSLILSETCAPVHVTFKATYYILSHYVNSINYDPANITIRTWWGDGTSTEKYNAQISPGVFQWTFDHVYPDNPLVCYWNSYMAPGIANVGYCYGGGLRKTFTYQNHSEDDEGDGIMQFNTDTIKVCIGQDFSKIFHDATYFNCNPQTEPDYPNDGRREIRFTYGTNNAPGDRIQNILINDIAESLPYVGSVITYDSIRTSGVPAPSGWANTLPISHIASVGPDAVGQIFEVKIENWNPCNEYDIFETNAPIVKYAYIKIVDGPIADAGSDFSICSGSTTGPLDGQINLTADWGVWSSTTGGSFNNPNLLNATYTPSDEDIAAGNVTLTLTATDESGVACPQHTDQVYITIIPAIFNNTVGSAQVICSGGNFEELKGELPTGGAGSYTYQWQISDDNSDWDDITGATDQNYGPGGPLTDNTYFRRVVTSGPCTNNSNSILITVRPTPTVSIAPSASPVCQDQANVQMRFTNALALPVTVNYDINGAGSYNINVPAGSFSNVAVPTGTAGTFQYNILSVYYQTAPVCTSNPVLSATVIVRETPSATVSGTTTVCRNQASTIRFTNTSPAPIRIRYRINSGGAITLNNVPAGGFRDVAAANATAGTFVYSFVDIRYQDNAPGCLETPAETATITVRPTPTATIAGNTTVCEDEERPDVTFTNPLALPITVTYNIGALPSATIDVPGNSNASVECPTDVPGTFVYNLISAVYQDGSPGCSAAVVGSATVTVRPTPTASISGSTTVCQGDASPNITFTNPQLLAVTVTYTLNGGANQTIDVPASSDATLPVPTGGPGDMIYELVNVYYQGTPGCTNNIAGSATVNIRPTPGATISGTTTVCRGSASPDVTFTNSVSQPVRVTYNINGGAPATIDINGSSTETLPAPTGVAGIFNYNLVSIVYQAAPACTTPIAGTAIITVSPPSDGGAISGGDTPVCFGTSTGTMTLSGHTGDIVQWEKRLGAGAWAGISNTTDTYEEVPSSAGTWEYRALVKSGECPEVYSTSNFITAQPTLEPGTIGSDQSLCQPADPAGFTGTLPTGGSGAYTYEWRYGNTAGGPYGSVLPASNTQNYNVPGPLLAGSYYYVRTVTSGACGTKTSNEIRVIVNPSRTDELLTLTIPAEACRNTEINAGYEDVENADEYVWDFSWNGPGIDATTPSPELDIDLSTAGAGGTSVLKGTYTIKVAGINGCNLPADYPWQTKSIDVNDIPDLSIPVVSICSDEASGVTLGISNEDINFCGLGTFNITDIDKNGLSESAGSPATGSGLLPGVISDDAYTNTSDANVNVIYTIVPVSAQGCPGAPEDLTLTITPEPDLKDLDKNQCSNTAIGVTLDDIHNLATLFDVSADALPAGLTGTPTEGSDLADGAIAGDVFVNKTSGPLDVTYRVTPKIGAAGCVGDEETVVVTIDPEPDLKDLDKNQCSSVAIGVTLDDVHNLATLFDVSADALPAGLTGTPTEGSALADDAIAGDVFVNKTSGPLSVTYHVTPGIGAAGCTGAEETVVVTIDPEPDLKDLDKSQCSSMAIGVTLDDELNMATLFDVAADPLPAGLTGTPTEGLGLADDAIAGDEFVNKTSGPLDVTYRVTPGIGAAGCYGAEEAVVVTITPEPDLKDLDKNQCSNTAIGVTLDDVHNLATLFDVSADALPAGLTGTPTEGSDLADGAIAGDVFVNKTSGPLDVTYRVTPKIGAAGCVGDEETVVVTIDPEPDLKDLDKVICSNTATGITLEDEHDLANSFEIVSVFADPALTADPGNAAAGADQLADAIADDKFTNITALPHDVTYRVIPRIAGGCIGEEETITVTVNPEPDLADLNTTVCNNVAINVTLSDVLGLADEFDIISITPQPDLTAGGGNVIAAAGQDADYIENDVWINSATGTRTVTYVVRPSIGGVCYGVSENVIITVRPPIVPGSVVTTKASVCYGTDAPLITNMVEASGGDGAIEYLWFYTEDPDADPGEPGWISTGITDEEFDPGNLINPTRFVRRAKDGSCAAEVYSNVILFNIDPLPVTSAIDGEEMLCVGEENKIYFVKTPRTAGSTYAWTVPAGITMREPDPDFNLYYIIVDAVAPTGPGMKIKVTETLPGTGCVGIPVEFPVMVTETRLQVEVEGDDWVCKGATGVRFWVPSNPGSVYKWTAPGGIIPGADNQFEVFVDFPNEMSVEVSCVETNGACQTFHNARNVTVRPLPTLSSSLTPPAVCSEAPFIYNPSCAIAGATYAWSRAAVPGISEPPSVGAGNINETLTNISNEPVSVTYQFVTTADGCPGPAQNVVVIVNPKGQVDDPADQVLCAGEFSIPVSFSTGNTGGSTTYSWTNSNTAIGLAISGTGNIASFTALNPGPSQVSATITVTPRFTNAGVSCDGDPETFTITVNPQGQVNKPANIIACNGEALGALAFITTNTDGTTTYTWTNSDPTIGLGASGDGDLPAFTAINAGTSPVTANIVVTPHYENSGETCDGPAQAFTITVNPSAQVNDPADQVVCHNGSTATVSFGTLNTGGTTTYTWTCSGPFIGLASPGAGTIASFTAENPGLTPVTATIEVTPHFTNGGKTCDGTPQTFTITVNPAGQVEPVDNQVLCHNAATDLITFATLNTGGSVSYTWTNDNTGIGLAASGSGGTIAVFTAKNTGTEPAVANITVTPHFLNEGVTCTGAATTFTITVNPSGQVNDPANITVCNGGTVADILFSTINTGGVTTWSWANNNTDIGLGATDVGDIPSFTATNATTSPITGTITVTPSFTSGGETCSGPPQTFTITVNPEPQVNVPANQVVCNGQSAAAVTFTTTVTGGATSYTWTNSDASIGLPLSGDGNLPIFTASNLTTAPVTATIEVTPHFTNNGVTCDGAPVPFTITVNPAAQVDAIDDQVVCNGDPTTLVTFATENTVGTTTYSWTNSAPSIGLPASGTTVSIPSFAAENTGTSPVTATITVTPKFSWLGRDCTGPSETFTITVNPTPQVTDPADQVVCNGAPVTAVSFSTVITGGTMVYRWTNSDPTIGLDASGTGNIASFNAINAGLSQKVVTIEVTPEFTNGGVTCVGTPQTFTIKINPTAHVDDILSQVVCNGAATTDVLFTTDLTDGSVAYNWTNNRPGINLPASGTGNILSFTASNITTAPVVATITVTPQYTNDGITCNGPAKIFTITVNPSGQVNDPADQVVCDGAPTALVHFTTANTGGATSFTWANSEPLINLPAAGSDDIASFTAANAGTSPLTGIITVTPRFETCVGPAQTFEITVNPAGQVNPVDDQVVCTGTYTDPVAFTTVNTGGSTSYSWTNSNAGIGLPASGSGIIPAFMATNLTGSPVTATIRVTPVFNNGGVNCTGAFEEFTITVNPAAQVNKPGDLVVCNGEVTSVINFVSTNTGGTPSFTWTNSDATIGLAASGTDPFIPAFTAANTGTLPITAIIMVMPFYENGGVTCSGPVRSFTITVNPEPTLVVPSDRVVCEGSSVSAINFTTVNTGGTTTYAWANSETAIGLGAGASGPVPVFTAQNPADDPLTAVITVIPTFTNGKACTGLPQTFDITVNPTAQVDDPVSQVVCNGALTDPVVFTTVNGTGTTVYNWTNNATSIGLAAGGTNDIPAFTATNNGSSPVTATITVTPVFTHDGVSCSGPSKTLTITVNPSAQVNKPADRILCHNAASAALNFTTTNTGGVTTYSWSNTNTDIGLAAGAAGNLPAFTATNTTTAPISGVITVTPQFENGGEICNGTPQDFTITVNPAANVDDPDDQELCNGEDTDPVVFTTTNTDGTTTYTWTNSKPSIGLAAGGTGDIDAFTAINTGAAPVIATITVTPRFENGAVTCTGPVQTFTITVNPTAQVNDHADMLLCNDEAVPAIVFTTVNTGGATTYAWTNTNTDIGLAAGGSGDLPAFTATNTTNAPISGTITVTPLYTGGVACSGPPQTFTITVNPSGQVNLPANQVVCDGQSTSSVVFTTLKTGGITTYEWTNDQPGIGLGASGEGSIPFFTAINNGTEPVVANIEVTPFFTNGAVTCEGAPVTFTITVNPEAQVNPVADQVVCNGDLTTLVTFGTANTVGATTYSWTNTAASIGLAASGTSASIPAFTAENTGTSPVVATITVTPHFDYDGETCDGPAETFTITVNPDAQVNSHDDIVVCKGATVAAISFSTVNTGGSAVYSWTNDETGIGLAASGTGTIPLFTAANPGTDPLIATITVTPEFTNGSVSCDGLQQTFTITVNPTAQVDDIDPQALCNGDPTDPVDFTTSVISGTMTYSWTNSATSIGLAAFGDDDIPSFTAVNTGNAPVVATITVTPHYLNDGVTCNGPSKTFTITVNPTAHVDDPANLVVCAGENTEVNFTTNNTGYDLMAFTWTNDNTDIGIAGIGSGDIGPFAAENTGAVPEVATIVVTPHFTFNGVTCDGPAQTFTITVNPLGELAKPGDQVVCNNSYTDAVIFSSVNTGGTTTYTWVNDNPAIGLGASGSGNISAFKGVNGGLSPITGKITVTPHFTNGTVTCDGAPQEFTITVNPGAKVTKPVDQALCNGDMTAPIVFTTTNTGADLMTYNWTNSAPSIGLEASNTGNIASFAAVNTGTAPVVATISVTPLFEYDGATCTGAPVSFTITVNPDAQVNDPADITVCNGATVSPVSFTTVNTGGATSYTWSNTLSSIGLPAAGVTSTPSFTAVNNGTTAVTATVTVIPQFTNAGETCDGDPETFTILVNPTPNVSTSSDLEICSAEATGIALSSNVAGATFSWAVGSVTGPVTGATAGSGSTISQVLVNTGSTPGYVTYAVTPVANSCPGTPVNITVTVYPTPVVTSGGLTTICSETATAVNLSSTVVGATFNWVIGGVTGDITGQAPGTGNTISQVLSNPGSAPGTVTYRVTPVANGCAGLPLNVTVTVNPKPTVSTASPTTICSGTTTDIVLTGSVTGTAFSWTVSDIVGGITGATAFNGTTIAQALNNPGTAPGSVTYRVTPVASSCTGDYLDIVVTVNPVTGPTIFTGGETEVCQDAPDETYTTTAANRTSVSYSVAPANAGVINAATGLMNWDPDFYGTATITAVSAGACGSTTGELTVRVKQLPSVTDPADQVTCEFGVVDFEVDYEGDDVTFQWQVDDNEDGVYAPVPTGDVYTGFDSRTLQVWGATRSMDSLRFRVIVSGCATDAVSDYAVLTVNTAPEITDHPKDSVICDGADAEFTAAADGTGLTWKWYVNRGSGGFVPLGNDAVFGGTTTPLLTVTDAPVSVNNWLLRAQVTGACGVPVYTNFARLSVIKPPVPTIQPADAEICENGMVTFNGSGSGYMNMRWQVSTDNGTSWSNITDDATYLGSETNQLTVMNAPVSLDGNLYRLALEGACTTVATNDATLTVNPNPVVSFAGDINACGGVPLTIDGNPTGGTTPYRTHAWTGDVGPLSSYTVQAPIFTSGIAGSSDLTYTVTDNKGCTATGDVTVNVDSPDATFAQDISSGCTPVTVRFTKNMSGIAEWSWDFGDGSPLNTTDANPVHEYVNNEATSIQYRTVTLKVRSAGGCEIEKSSMVTVYPAIDATFTADKDLVCNGDMITFTALSGASVYSWNFGDGITLSGANVATHTYTNTTADPVVRTVRVTTTSFYGCVATSTITVTILPKPVPQFFAAPVQQVYNSTGNNVTFTNETNPGAFTWSWTFGDGGTSADKNTSHTYTNVGEYNVTLAAANGTCSGEVSHKVFVNPLPPVASFDSVPSGCEPLQVTINNTSENTNIPGTTYSWDFGDGSISTAKNPDYTYHDPGVFRITLTVTGPGGISTKSRVVHVYASPEAMFEVTPDKVFVNDEKVRGVNLSSGADYYIWEWGDGDTSKMKDPFHKYMKSGIYDVSLSAYKDNGNGNICYDRYVLSPGVVVEPAGEIRFASVFRPNLSGELMPSPPIPADMMDMFFYPPIQEKVLEYKLQVFNRQGVLIFESHDLDNPWNGYYKGRLCPQGVYVWYVEGKYANGQPYKKVGDITLLH